MTMTDREKLEARYLRALERIDMAAWRKHLADPEDLNDDQTRFRWTALLRPNK
jgi:hypothetical protein